MRRPSAIAIGLVVLLLTAMAVVGFVGMPMADTDDEGVPLHADPAEYAGDGDLDAIQAWLGGWLDTRLSDSLIEISEGQADTAREALGEEYTQRLGQFVDVSDDEDDTDAYQDAQEDHDRLAELLDEYNQTWVAYEDALERGDAEAAHSLAREINALADEIEAISDRILERVDRIQLRPDAIAAVENTRDTVSNTSQQVREEHFTETVLTVTAHEESTSFTSPAMLAGTLETADGEPVADRTIEIVVNDRSYLVETDESGAFTLEFRPVDLPLGENELDVIYVPDPASEYLGTFTSVTVEVEQVEPTVTLALEEEQAGYGDIVTFDGTLAVEELWVDGVALEVTLDGMALGEVTVDDGDFTGEFEVPADIEAGEAALEVRLPFEDQALAGVSITDDLTIIETETDLSLDVVFDAETETLDISGDLQTIGDRAVSDQPIHLSIGDTQSIAVQTADDGTFSETIAVPEDVDENVTVVATFDGAGTNLVGAEADMTVSVEVPTTTSVPWVALALVAVLLLVGVGGWWYRRGLTGDETGETTTVQTERRSSMVTHQVEDSEAILDAALEQLAADRYNEAVVLGYGAMRSEFGEHLDDDRAFTHWEFLDAIRTVAHQNGMSDGMVEQLADATDAFERASFDPRGVDVDAATEVIDSGRDIVQ